ncbi:MAG: hypothetical protein COX80_01190 [Candidatus Magasanikbacteria bacterium CG_4_10_14_0_2_um_filter_33_14]|uniref:DUF5640 domain-containing protein n=1 Tax=Candidatus Magasanikbacteria bacterium CG_4_10_14_0_2_um_filter_33_14 TaxID=1974636 RepID=A0A2M7VBM4_9BACT|nr:MAG: hypothetical protein COX80_01190 [Candidatus Magasanikbacteria bacterium CG_4_10_14_0_2_um_filter_33_14]
MNKKFSLVAALSVLALVGAGCSSTTSTGDVSDTGSKVAETATQGGLDGTWKIMTATGEFASMNEGTKYIFAGDSLTTKLGIIETKGTITSKTDSALTVQFEGMNNPSNFTYRFDGTKLILEPAGGKQVFTLEKQ